MKQIISLFTSATSRMTFRQFVMLWTMALSCVATASNLCFDNLGGITRNICVRDIDQSEDDMIWLAAESGLYSFDGYHVVNRPMLVDGGGVADVGSCNCIEISGDSMLVGTNKGLYVFNLASYSFNPVPYVGDEIVKCVLADANTVWVATDNHIYKNGMKLTPGVSGVISIYRHGEYLYVGTVDGLYRYSLTEKQMERMPLGMSFVSCFFSNDDELLWLGSAAGVRVWNVNKQEIVFAEQMPVVKSINSDWNGNTLVCTDDGLYVIDRDYHIESYAHEAGNENSLSGDAVWTAYKDEDGNMWFGTNNGVSLSNDMMAIYSLPSITGKSYGNHFLSVFRDTKRRLWLGGSNGLLCIEDIGEVARRYRWYRMDDEKYPIFHNRIRTIFESSSGEIVIGGDGGLMLYDEDTEQFVRYNIREDADNWVYEVGESDTPALMVTTFRATYLGHLDHESRELKVEKTLNRRCLSDMSDSLLFQYDISPDWLSAYCADDSLVLLGGIDRFALFTDAFVKETDRNGISITDVRINGNRYASHTDILNGQISLSQADHYIEILFSDFLFSGNFLGKYVYRFNDGEWLPAYPRDNVIILANLPSGNNVLQIKHADGEDVLLSFNIAVACPWYASPVAKGFYVLIIMIMAYGVWRIRRQRVQIKTEQQKRQQLMESSKQKEQTLINDKERLALQLKMQIIDKAEESGELSDDEKFLARITRLIEKNMSNPDLNVNVLSDISGVSSKQLYRRIKTITGLSTVAYIRDLRMKKAASLLSKGTYSVSEVMYIVGYNNLSYFTHCFAEEFKLSPSNYRKRQKTE